MTRLWDISIRSPLRETSQRHLRDISKKTPFLRRLWDISNISQKRRLSYDIFETSQMYLKNDVFFEAFKIPLQYISKKVSFMWRLWDVWNTSQKRCLLCDVLKMSQIHFIKDAFYATSLRCLKYISKKYLLGAAQKGCHQVRGERSNQK